MDLPAHIPLIAIGWIALAILLFPIQLFITAPYGRHAGTFRGLTLPNRLGWIIMEVVSPLVFGYFFLSGDNPKTTPMWVFFGLWTAHYLHRSLIFPFRLQTRGKRIPLMIVLSAMLFNVVNGWLNGDWLGAAGPVYPESWLQDPRFILGLLIFLAGAGINLWADTQLINLRKKNRPSNAGGAGEGGYVIPRGGLFDRVSCPNHFGEMVEWTGFAVMCWNLPALSFAVWTVANLLPRALSHHRWYREKFAEYPGSRKAVWPGIL